jgi:CHAT domain-containing protein/tetratricopeptide (TPR) repeat protein
MPDGVANAFSGLLDYCESQQPIALVIAKHNVTREDLRRQFWTLLTEGGGRTFGGHHVAVLAFANASTLNYLLSSPAEPPDRKLSEIEGYLQGGRLVYVSSFEALPDEADRRAAAPFIDEGPRPEADDEPPASTAPPEAPTRKRALLVRAFLLFRWASLRRQLPALAGDGRFAELLDVATRAASTARDCFGEDDVRTALFLSLAQKEHGDYAEALATVRRAQRISEREWELLGNVRGAATQHGHMLLEQADCLRQSASIRLAMGDHEGALQDVERALERFAAQRTRFNADSEAYVLRGRSGIECLELKGDVHMARDELAQAEPVYRAALKARQEVFGPGNGEMALGYLRLGALLDRSGRFDAAEDLHKNAVRILESIPAFGEVHLPRALLARAAHWQDVGQFDAAEQDLLKARTLLGQRNLDDSPESIQAQVSLSMVYAATGRTEAAFESFTRALDRLDGFTAQVFAVSSERQRAQYLATVTAYVETFASFVLQYLPRDTRAVGALARLLFKYKAIGPELLARQRARILADRHPELADKLTKLTRLRAALAEIELRRRKSPTPSSVVARLRTAQESLEQELAVALPEMKDVTGQTPKSLSAALPEGCALIDVFRGRACNFAAVPSRRERRMGAARYIACVLFHGRDEAVRLVDLGEAETVDRLIAAFRSAVAGDDLSRGAEGDGAAATERNAEVLAAPGSRLPAPAGRPHSITAAAIVRDLTAPAGPARVGDERSGDAEGEALAKALLVPLLEAAGDCRRLFVAPDGDLLRLPLEVLPVGPDRRLIDDEAWQVSYLSAGRDVLRFVAALPDPPAPALVVAAPDFDLGAVAASTTRGIPFSPLTGTRDEGVRIAARLGVAPLVGADALERRVKAGRSPRVLHIASHGFFLRDHRGAANGSGPSAAAALDRSDVTGLGLVGNPLLRSGFALAGANSWLGGASLPDAAEDGLLTAEDVSAMDLRQTELAVLSACNTGLGESQFGEGVMGLRRAFVLAGARTLVMSLWKVPDAATAELMDAFYQFLLAGVPRAEALRRAQHQLKKRYPNPFFWGAFICQGDPGPVSRSLLDQAMLLRDALSKRHD